MCPSDTDSVWRYLFKFKFHWWHCVCVSTNLWEMKNGLAEIWAAHTHTFSVLHLLDAIDKVLSNSRHCCGTYIELESRTQLYSLQNHLNFKLSLYYDVVSLCWCHRRVCLYLPCCCNICFFSCSIHLSRWMLRAFYILLI